MPVPGDIPRSATGVRLIGASRCAAAMAVMLVAGGCGGGGAGHTATHRYAVVPTSKVEAAIAAQIKASAAGQPGVNNLTLGCAKGVKVQRGNNFTCNLLTEQGKAFAGTVLVVVTNKTGTSYRYKGEFNGKPVSGKIGLS
jgi:hypothetical protein